MPDTATSDIHSPMKMKPPESSFRIKRRVLYADTDRMGVVYHSAYLRYAEAGRAELMRAKGFSYREMEDSGLMLPIIETWMRHYAPARYDEEIDIITWIEDTGGAHVTFCYVIEIDSKPLVECYTKHTCINMENKVVRLPEKIILMAPDA